MDPDHERYWAAPIGRLLCSGTTLCCVPPGLRATLLGSAGQYMTLTRANTYGSLFPGSIYQKGRFILMTVES